jgi:UDP-N-acetylmuramoylalanine--D-glutamate ligase
MHSYGKAKSHIYGKQAVAIMPRGDDVVAGLLPKDAAKKKTELRRIMTFGVDMPQVAGDYGLENVNGMTWLVKAAAPETEGKRLVDEDLWIQRLMPADALRLRGQHNALNALAALALASSCGASLAPMLHALREYRGEPHRMQSIGVVNDIEYIDDSKGTNVGATLAAVHTASQHAQTADIVLLSPACSSLDMFKNYAERGSQFEACVQGMILEEGHA